MSKNNVNENLSVIGAVIELAECLNDSKGLRFVVAINNNYSAVTMVSPEYHEDCVMVIESLVAQLNADEEAYLNLKVFIDFANKTL